MKKNFILLALILLLFVAKKFLVPYIISNNLIPNKTIPLLQEEPYSAEEISNSDTISPFRVVDQDLLDQVLPTFIEEINKELDNNLEDLNIDQNQEEVDDGYPWGVSRQVGEHSWIIKVGQDSKMTTPMEALEALNQYRIKKGSQPLTWDDKLATYAHSRAQFFIENKGLDSHQGFSDFLKNQDGFKKLAFTAVGENASIGYRLTGTHLIEWVYAGDKPHDDNQLNNRWDHVGIGIVDTATCFIFAAGKIN